MGNQRDYYDVLGLKRGADEKEIKSVYRKLVKKYHPDANPDDASAREKIREINDAYAVLSDPQKRADYDMHGHSGADRSRTRNDGGPFTGGFGSDIDIDDLFTGGFGDYFRGGTKKGTPGRGRNTSAKVYISWDEAVSGTEKKITVSFSEKCVSCNGAGSKSGQSGQTAGICNQCNGAGQERVVTQSAFGKMTQTRKCPACGGTGKDRRESCLKCSGRGYSKINKNIIVKIPKGFTNGQTVKIRDMGEPGSQDGPRGDLLVEVIVRPKYGF